MNLPNKLTVLRIIMVPFFVFFMLTDVGGEANKWIALILFCVASLTDMLDGKIARKYNLTTKLGKILDPLGDKLMSFSALVAIMLDGVVPLWTVGALLVKELLMAVGGLFMYRKEKDVMPSNYFGKAATVVFFIVCMILIIFRSIPAKVATGMISVALALSFLALITYIIKFLKFMKKELVLELLVIMIFINFLEKI